LAFTPESGALTSPSGAPAPPIAVKGKADPVATFTPVI